MRLSFFLEIFSQRAWVIKRQLIRSGGRYLNGKSYIEKQETWNVPLLPHQTTQSQRLVLSATEELVKELHRTTNT